MASRAAFVGSAVALTVVMLGGPAFACGALLAPNGTIDLVRTATLAAYHNGIEHYVTAFEFQGKGRKFGSIVPLPGIPTDVKRGGDWTLQRLQQEVTPVQRKALVAFDAAELSAARAQVILTTKVDALDITVLKGGGDEVGLWAKEHGFLLPPDAPEILDFYGERSPIFMAVNFNVARARAKGRTVGDSIPVHVVVPTKNPWVPLRILTLGLEPNEIVEADVFLLTDRRPAILPRPRAEGFALERSETASSSLLSDLRSDKGMGWLPAEDVHLTYLKIDTPASTLDHDLAVDVSGLGAPSLVDAGLRRPEIPFVVPDNGWNSWAIAVLLIAVTLAFYSRVRAAA